MRHGRRPKPGEVRTYFLSPEELAKYRAMPTPSSEKTKRKRKEAKTVAKTLSSETHERVDAMIREGTRPTTIAKEARVSIGTVYDRAAKLGTPRYDMEGARWVSAENAEQPKDAEKVKEMQKRIEQLIQEGVSPDEIRRREVVSKATLTATCERLGVEWIGERWESVAPKVPDVPESPEATKAPETTPEEPESLDAHDERAAQEGESLDTIAEAEKEHAPSRDLAGAVMDGIAAGKHADQIAREEHVSIEKVMSLGRKHGWLFNRHEVWVRLFEKADARRETPQGAEAHDAIAEIKAHDEALIREASEASEGPGARFVEIAVRMTKRDALTALRDCWALKVALDELREKDAFGPDLGEPLARLVAATESLAEAVLLQ